MTDDSFKYTLHDHGVAREMVGNNRDVYVLLRDKIDLEVCKLESKIDRIKTYCVYGNIIGVGVVLTSIGLFVMGLK